MSRTRAAAAAVVLTPVRVMIAVLVALLLAGCSADPSTGTAAGTQRIEIGYAGGAVTGGVRSYPVPVGATVELVVTSDVADEVHVHGYDRRSFVTAGASTTLTWVADLPGGYEVELEQRGVPLCELQVS